MPKRSVEEKIAYYKHKLKKLDTKTHRKRVIRLPSSSDSESIEDSHGEDAILNPESMPQIISQPETHGQLEPELPSAPLITDAEPQTLPIEILTALGDPVNETPKYGEDIHQDLAQRWLPLLRKGLSREIKDQLYKDYLVPDNCKLLRAPSLNPEISAAVADSFRGRDKKLELKQQQLGLGISAISKAMTVLLTSENKISAIKILSDSCKILTDLHYIETETRTKLLCGGLDKSFSSILENEERDETLFGAQLSEKIKAAQVIEKQGSQLKKHSDTAKPSTSQPTMRPRFQGNWMGPFRYQSNRGGRGGPARRQQQPLRNHSTVIPPTSHPQSRTYSTRHRAPSRR